MLLQALAEPPTRGGTTSNLQQQWYVAVVMFRGVGPVSSQVKIEWHTQAHCC